MATISDMLSKNAVLYPDDTALVEYRPSKGIRKEITWKELDEAANRVANSLLERDICRDDRVIHWMMNSIEWLQVYFGIIRTVNQFLQMTKSNFGYRLPKKNISSLTIGQ